MVKVIDLRKVYRPTDKQIQAHTAGERFVLYGGAVGGGKSVWLCNEGLQLSLECSGNVGYLCRHELASLMRTTLLTLERYLPGDIVAQHHQTENYYRLVNGSLIYYGGLGDDQRAIDRLKSMELGWFGIDQAEETSESHFFLLASRLRLKAPNVRYKGLMTANPAPGWVKHRFIEQKLDDHRFIPALPKDNPHLPADYESTLRELYPKELVQQLLEGDWDTIEAGMFLLRYGAIKSAVEREVEIDFNEPKVMGVDIAAEGIDESVAVIRQGNKVIWIETWSFANTMATTGKIITLIDRFKPNVVNLDAIGIGKGVHDRLDELKIVHNGVVVGETANDKEHYVNIRAEMYFSLQKRFEEAEISIPDDLDLIAQLSTIRWDFESDKRLKLVSKKEMKTKYRVKSPDKADALALAFMDSSSKEPRIRWI